MPLSDVQVITIMLVASIIFLIVVAVSAYFLFFYKKTQKEINQLINESLNKRDQNGKEKEITTVEGDILLDFEYIYDNIIVSKNNHSIILLCEGINFDMMSEKEKETLFYKYVSLFKNLDSTFQIFVRTNTIKQENQLDFNEILDGTAKDLRKDMTRYKQLSNTEMSKPEVLDKLRENLQKKELLAKYIKDFADYTKGISEQTEIVSKSYYVIISVDTEEQYRKNLIDNNLVKKYLEEKTAQTQKYLLNCNIQNHILNQYEICDLLYLIFNEDDDRLIQFKQSINAGLFNNYLKTDKAKNRRI